MTVKSLLAAVCGGAATLLIAAATATAPSAPAATAVPMSAHDAAALAEAVAFDRDASLASALAGENRCRFTPSRNPLRPRRNECRLA